MERSVTHSADDLVVVGEVRLARLAAVDALGVQVDVVGEAHLGRRSRWALSLQSGRWSARGCLRPWTDLCWWSACLLSLLVQI